MIIILINADYFLLGTHIWTHRHINPLLHYPSIVRTHNVVLNFHWNTIFWILNSSWVFLRAMFFTNTVFQSSVIGVNWSSKFSSVFEIFIERKSFQRKPHNKEKLKFLQLFYPRFLSSSSLYKTPMNIFTCKLFSFSKWHFCTTNRCFTIFFFVCCSDFNERLFIKVLNLLNGWLWKYYWF